MKHILISILLAGMAMTLQSCLHDDNEKFDTPAANRIIQEVAKDKQLLEAAPNGWELHYYSGSEYSGGGYTMLIRFENGKAHVSSDLTGNTSLVTTSSYDVIKDMGPVLTFNTYNELMHFLAQPYQSDVEGEQGDFEFLILEATPEKFKLKGKKWKNEMVMTRIPDGVVWKDYLEELKSVSSKLFFVYDNKIDGKDVSNLYLNKDGHRASLIGENMPSSAYYVTTKGIHLHDAINIGNGVMVSDLEVDPTTGELKVPGQPSLSIMKSADESKNLDISKLYGTWDLKCSVNDRSGGSSGSKTLKVDFEAVNNELETPYSTILHGTIHNGTNDYNFYLYYMADKGYLQLGGNNVEDPTKKQPYLEVAGLDSQYYFIDLKFKYDSANEQLTSETANATIAYLFLETDPETGEQGYNLAVAFEAINAFTNHVKK